MPNSLKLSIEGMSCGHCLNAVRGALDRTPGVTVETVTMGSASVLYDPAKTTPEQIIDAINDEGYTASAVT
ncbi:MAG: heavy-metal-associated domain-containing protein [Gemmatimonadaceae bacterium]|nr:heavy-metal-associated domain-containing protein [Gemmatimonadaceae bacterium]